VRAKIAPVQGSREQPVGVDVLSSTRVPRGHHKVFLGMAAGVGKTYQMLREGQADAENGMDVVIGYLEPHGRVETVAQAEGLEIIPRRRVTYRESVLEEMDLPAILRRRPELCLIDELAHTNAPGLEHQKRYEDVEDVLAAGIDVFSTVNVQHLESLNDQIAELTGTRVRETVPDAVIGAADEVVLIDITPQSLIERLIAGKVYPVERVESALNNFFKVENLSALREVALRQVAEEVEAKRIPMEVVGRPGDDRLIGTDAPQAVGERLLALITPSPKSQRVVRRAWRSAQRLGAELDVLWVADHDPNEQEQEQLDALRKLSSVLGAHLLVEHGDDIALVAQRVATDRGTTYVLMGTPKPRTALRRLTRPALPFRLLALLPGVDLRIVADRAKRQKEDL
jgi:two-component system sensor histidine kinase KdpD